MGRALHSIFHFSLDKIATVADCIKRVHGDIVSYIRLRAHHHEEVPHLVNAYNVQVCVSDLAGAQLRRQCQWHLDNGECGFKTWQ